ncbi:MAG: type II CAAX endopeptidase family protein [Verrucomicrobiae bacterium]|nr:type II CAAX endopeptidase family protein [Verrucomicrobiae bacterium]
MLWKREWRPDVVLLLVGAVLMSLFTGSLAVQILQRQGVAGFKTLDDTGSVLVATLSFHGAAIVAGIVFLKLHDIRWREALGWHPDTWRLQLLLTVTVLAAALPVMFGLKYLSVLLFQKMHWTVEDQRAVEMFSSVKSTGLRIYLGFFAVVLAPLGEEFVFRGLLFSAAKKYGWSKTGWIGVSLLFAAIHLSPPIFLPLFVLALALTWLYVKTEGLLAPIVAHSLFNAANIGLLLLAQQTGPTK